jgi:hypothetical protein
MPRTSALSPDQWAQARRRWEGCDAAGFEWLRREMEAAFGVAPSRPAIRQAAAKAGWEKGGAASQPLTAAGAVESVGAKVSPPEPVAKVSRRRREVADEVVDAAPSSSPPAAPASREYRGPGRPTSYRPEFATKIIEFFDVEPFEDIPVPQPSGLVKLQRMPRKPPMLGAFAKSIGVSKTAVDTWATAVNSDGGPRHPEFAEAYARARVMQEELLTVGGSMGAYESRFLAMVMKNLCGWQDQPAPKEDHAAVSKDELDRRFGQRMEAARLRQMAVLEERRALRRLADEAAGVGEADVPGLGYTPELAAGAADGQVREADEAHG